MFNVLDIQTLRCLSEQEVREINFIIKSRALRYIGAAREEWLYPERHVTKSDWNRYGHGYLLMPDPRSVAYGGETIIGYQDGRATAFDEYGRRPWDPDFKGQKAAWMTIGIRFIASRANSQDSLAHSGGGALSISIDWTMNVMTTTTTSITWGWSGKN
jgi:hypothetical protein